MRLDPQPDRVPDPGGAACRRSSCTSTLPPITSPLVIDGYSQPGSSTNDSSQFLAPDTDDDQETDIATIIVQIDGSQIDWHAASIGLDVQAPGCTIDGLSLTGFSGAAISLEPVRRPPSPASSATPSGATSSA